MEISKQSDNNSLIEENKTKRYVWVALISNDEYLPGVLALSRSLKRSKTIYPLIIMVVKNDVSEDVIQQIKNEGCHIKYIDNLIPKQDTSSLAITRFIHAWPKLRAFQLTDIADKCVFLDSDIIVLQNIDELFHLEDDPYFAAVQACICNPVKNSTYPKFWKPSNCPYTYDQKNSNDLLNIDERSRTLNSGLFLYHPDEKVFQDMLVCLNTWDLDEFKFADQDFLSKFFKNKWKCLPSIYNSLKVLPVTHPNLWDLSKIKVIHYIQSKPWNKEDKGNEPYENINKLWWDAYEFKSN